MCEPATIAYGIAAVLAVAGGVQAAETQRQTGRYNAAVAENNATMAEQSARDANLRGVRAADEQRMKTRMMVGKQRAALAAQGVTLDSGTSLDILGDTAMLGAIDEDTIRMNAAREAWGYQVQASNYRAQGALDKWSGKEMSKATYLSTAAQAVGSFAGGMGGGGFGGMGGGGGSAGGGSFASGFGSGASSAARRIGGP